MNLNIITKNVNITKKCNTDVLLHSDKILILKDNSAAFKQLQFNKYYL